jgi:hypothetical protein
MHQRQTKHSPDLQPVQAVCAALGHSRGEVSAYLDDASVLHVPGESGLAGGYHGGDAILALVSRMVELTDGSLRFETSRYPDERYQGVLLRGRVTATRRGRRLDTNVDLLISVRGDLLREIWISHGDQNQVDEFWA